MRGLKFEDLVAILDFLYYGEANIYQENLATFLNIAEELDLKGLSGGEGGAEDGGREQEISTKLTENPTSRRSSRLKESNSRLSENSLRPFFGRQGR